MNSLLNSEIIGFQAINDENKKENHIIFFIKIQTPYRAFFLERRYSDFYILHKELVLLFTRKVFPPFPEKSIFRNFDKKFLEKRKNELDTFLKFVISDELLQKTDPFKSFLLSRIITKNTSMQWDGNTVDDLLDHINYQNARLSSDKSLIFKDVSSPFGINIKEFSFLKNIGYQESGKVYLVKYIPQNEYYSMKVIFKSKEDVNNKNLMNELKYLHNNLKSPFLVRHSLLSISSSAIFILMDYVNGGNLNIRLLREKFFSKEECVFYASEIFIGVNFLHSRGIIHRNLIPKNILIDSFGHIKISDFSFAKLLDSHGKTNTFLGHPNYIPPEMAEGKTYDYSVDWWYFGLIIFKMLVGRMAYPDDSASEVYTNIINKDPIIPNSLSTNAKDLLLGLLKKSPSERFFGHTIKNHDFFSDVNWDLVSTKKINPIYVPSVTGCMDLKFFDPTERCEQFTSKLFDVIYQSD